MCDDQQFLPRPRRRHVRQRPLLSLSPLAGDLVGALFDGSWQGDEAFVHASNNHPVELQAFYAVHGRQANGIFPGVVEETFLQHYCRQICTVDRMPDGIAGSLGPGHDAGVSQTLSALDEFAKPTNDERCLLSGGLKDDNLGFGAASQRREAPLIVPTAVQIVDLAPVKKTHGPRPDLLRRPVIEPELVGASDDADPAAAETTRLRP